MTRAYALIGHGSRRGEGNEELFHLATRLRARSGRPVTVGFIELATPTAASALDAAAREADEVVAIPAVLLAAAHAKNDVPLAVVQARLRHPRTRFVASRPLGTHPALLAALGERFTGAAPPAPADRTAVLLLGRGSSDPDANAEMHRIARLFAERRGLLEVGVGFIGVTTPTSEDAFHALLLRRPKAVVVLPYLLYPGVLVSRIQARFAELAALHPRVAVAVAEPLGTHAAVEAVLLDRAEEALRGEGGPACDACKYRAPIDGFVADVGGVQALRKARAHLAIPPAPDAPAHAHAPPVRHVLVCVNRDCADRGSVRVLGGLRRELRAAGAERSVQTTRVMCLGRCGDGPAVVVYPDGVWYRRVTEGDVPAVVTEHLLGGSPVGRLIDQLLG